VTAYARYYLRKAEEIAYEYGYETVAGITDSLFLRALPGTVDSYSRMEALTRRISEVTGVPMNIDGRFKWIVFTNIRESQDISALNRYFGCYTTGKVKIRGIEARKHSTCRLVKEFQGELLGVLSQADTKQEFLDLIPRCLRILEEWQERLVDGVDPDLLVIKIRSGKGSKGYKSNSIQAEVAREYDRKGKALQPGQSMRYIVRDYNAESGRRITIKPEVTKESRYDVAWYSDLLEHAFLDLFETVMLKELGKILLPKSESGLDYFFQ